MRDAVIRIAMRVMNVFWCHVSIVVYGCTGTKCECVVISLKRVFLKIINISRHILWFVCFPVKNMPSLGFWVAHV